VARAALVLFDRLRPFHAVSPDRRPLLETVALVHDVGVETNPDQHHIAGRDILLAHPPEGLTEEERQMVATIVFLHRKRINSKKLSRLADTAFSALPKSMQDETLTMAALLRMADGLDYSQTGTSQLGEMRQLDGVVEFAVTGPNAAMEAARAQEKSDLWHLLSDTEVRFRSPEMAPLDIVTPSVELAEVVETPAEQEAPKLPERPGLEPDDGMAEAARKTLRFHFQRMLYHEPGTCLGEDIEELHQMRVATRRMRAAIGVFGNHLNAKQIAPFAKGLKRTGRVLGSVRDLDVFWVETQSYLETLAPERQGDLDPLRAVWEQERARNRDEMLAYLSSERFARFAERFAAFLDTPLDRALPALGSGEPQPYRLRHVLPVTVYERLVAVRAYDEWVTGPSVPLERLHQLRITAKRLRYTLEFFQEVLGPEAKVAIKETKRLQDHLGDLQDAVVASGLLRDFLTWGTWGHTEAKGKRMTVPKQPIVAPGVAAYLAARQTELQHLLDTFPQAWAPVHEADFGHLVAASLATL
jgi:CHAD domain-containing protein